MKLAPPVRKNDDIELSITALSSEGQGIGRVDGYAVFVMGAAPGDRVRCHCIKVTSSYAVAKLIEIIEPSPDRVQEKCPVANRCGGCSLQHIAYSAQLDVKRKQVEDALSRLGGIENPNVFATIGMDEPWRYRNKASFPAREMSQGVCFGFFAKNSHRIVPIDDCLIQDENGVAVMNAVRMWAEECGITVYDETTRKGVLRHVVTRTTSLGETMAIIVTTRPMRRDEELIEKLTSAVPSVKSIVNNINNTNSNVIFGDTFITVYGESTVRERILGIDFSVSAPSFLQVNHEQTEKLYNCAVDALELCGDELVFDVYCGIGTISLPVARRAKRVIGIEEVAEAVCDARANANANKITNAEFIAERAEIILPKLIEDGMRPDAIILDPPRKGCDAEVLEAIAASGVAKLVYVSCNPATLARDCKQLIESGYRLISAQPVDMFPQTSHVETVCLLVLRNPVTHINIDVDVEELVQDKRGQATYEQIRDYVMEQTGLHVTNLNIAQIKRKCGIIERENYNLPKSKDSKQPNCTKEKEKAIKEAFKHFGMI